MSEPIDEIFDKHPDAVNPELEKIQSFTSKYPKQLWYLFTVEMWERFCFYGMRGMLTVFMASQLGLTDKEIGRAHV